MSIDQRSRTNQIWEQPYKFQIGNETHLAHSGDISLLDVGMESAKLWRMKLNCLKIYCKLKIQILIACVPWTEMSKKKDFIGNGNDGKIHIIKLSLHEMTLEFYLVQK